jgi:predicted AAA+ superfamily ATPase
MEIKIYNNKCNSYKSRNHNYLLHADVFDDFRPKTKINKKKVYIFIIHVQFLP